MTTRNKKKMAALNKENWEEHPMSNLAQNSSAPRSQEDYITQFSEEIEGRVTKRLSKEFSRTENRILGALARLDDFLMNPLLPGHSGTTPEPSRNALNTSQGTNENDSQNDPRPEAGLFQEQMTQNSGPEDGHDTCFKYFLLCFPILPFSLIDKVSAIPSLHFVNSFERKSTEKVRICSLGAVFMVKHDIQGLILTTTWSWLYHGIFVQVVMKYAMITAWWLCFLNNSGQDVENFAEKSALRFLWKFFAYTKKTEILLPLYNNWKKNICVTITERLLAE